MSRIMVAFCNGLLQYAKPGDYRFPIFMESFLDGLHKEGNDVLFFQHGYFNRKFPFIPNEIKDAIVNFNPELCVIFNNAFYDLKGVVDCPIIIYGADGPIYFSNKYLLEERGNDYIYALREDEECEFIKENYRVKTNRILKITSFTSIQHKRSDYKRNICFIGTKFRNINAGNIILDFLKDHKESGKRIISETLELINENPLVTDAQLYLMFPILKTLNKPINVNMIVDLLSSEKRLGILSVLTDKGLELFGREDWLTDYYYDTNLALCFNNRDVISLAENEDIYNSSKIGLSISHIQAREGYPWRVMDIMASGALLISDYHDGILRDFPEVKIPMYKNRYEAREICEYYLKHDSEREGIVSDCNRLIDKRYRLTNLLNLLEQASGIQLICRKIMVNRSYVGYCIDIDRAKYQICTSQ